MTAVVLVLAVVIIILALITMITVGGYRDLAGENRRLRAEVVRTSAHPAAYDARARGVGRAVGEPLFADTLAAIRRLPEAPAPTLRLDEVTEEITYGGDA